MNKRVFYALYCLCILYNCKERLSLDKVKASRVEINDSLIEKEDIKSFIAPYKQHIDSSLNAILSYSPDLYTKNDGELNTAIGNMIADAVFELAGPVFNKRSGKALDFVLLNHGGIRSVLPKGNINSRTAYKIMPFENEVVVVGLTGLQLQG
ncbi:MAG: 5'-nucleotidase C-terminal domain-containing protein, partial [Bacteroidota bacterium]